MEINTPKIPILKTTKTKDYGKGKRKELVEVHRDGKVFYQQREVGKEEEKEKKFYEKKYKLPENLKKLSPALKEKYGDVSYDEAYKAFYLEAAPAVMAIAAKWQGKYSIEDLAHHAFAFLYTKFYMYDPKISNPKTWSKYVVGYEIFWYNKPSSLNESEWNNIVRKSKVIEREYYKLNGEKIPLKELAKKMKLSPERIQDVLLRAQKEISLDQSFAGFGSNDLMPGDLITYKDSEYDNPEKAFEAAEIKVAIDDALNSLEPLERKVFELNNGIQDGNVLNDSEIAKLLKTNPVQIKRIKESALNKLKNYDKLKNFIEKSIEEEKENFVKQYLKFIDNLAKKMEEFNNNQELVDVIKSLTEKIDEKLKNYDKNYNNVIDDIRIRQRDPKIFIRKSLKTANITKSIKMVYGLTPNDSKLRIQTLIFNRDPNKGQIWDLKKAKQWAKDNKNQIKTAVDINDLVFKCQSKINTISK